MEVVKSLEAPRRDGRAAGWSVPAKGGLLCAAPASAMHRASGLSILVQSASFVILLRARALGGALISEVEEALITRIELIFAVDPDNHSGSLEWPIVIVLLAASISATFCALYEWRRVSAATR